MNGHTPRPWQWYWRSEANEASCGVFWEKFKGHAVSVCRAPRYESRKQWSANAALIVAAPDYHDAAHRLAMLVLQSDFYRSSPDVTESVDNVLLIHRRVKNP